MSEVIVPLPKIVPKSVVLGDVIDMGESTWRFEPWVDIPFERVSKTTYPMQRHFP
jgi:hypothetical protein